MQFLKNVVMYANILNLEVKIATIPQDYVYHLTFLFLKIRAPLLPSNLFVKALIT